mmetsp:Transcript_40553/g.78951  ORF Transcript_40553/g.78951 Transcript_40553/m.78951 type:complete len:277 (-) Transcript_40553:672-1502(-)
MSIFLFIQPRELNGKHQKLRILSTGIECVLVAHIVVERYLTFLEALRGTEEGIKQFLADVESCGASVDHGVQRTTTNDTPSSSKPNRLYDLRIDVEVLNLDDIVLHRCSHDLAHIDDIHPTKQRGKRRRGCRFAKNSSSSSWNTHAAVVSAGGGDAAGGIASSTSSTSSTSSSGRKNKTENLIREVELHHFDLRLHEEGGPYFWSFLLNQADQRTTKRAPSPVYGTKYAKYHIVGVVVSCCCCACSCGSYSSLIVAVVVMVVVVCRFCGGGAMRQK